MNHQIELSRARHSPFVWLAAALLAMITHPLSSSLAQEAYVDEEGTEVLTRGPVHEAFAGIISYDSLPGVVVAADPPDLIEEVPPGERPVGDDVTWIPGYWAWDDERDDFLWVSGIWRALPPGRNWIVGYWGETTAGYQWTSGYWADAVAEEIVYLPAPPRTLEVGPNIEAPSSNHGWTPGSWVWGQERYAWSPGYWAEVRPDWDWIPSHYVWTRRGHVYVGGYWDYSVQRRGVLFAPVYFSRGVYSRPGYSYSPSIVFDLGMFTSHLFLRPNYDHYYFGDYYAPRYRESGFYASFSFHISRRGYDPIYAHNRWMHRDDREWERRIERDFQHRRDDERARPPRTWAEHSRMDRSSSEVRENQSMLATSFDQLTEREDSTTRFQAVDDEDRQRLARRGEDVQRSREQRRDLEGRNADGRRDGEETAASRVPSFVSPIVARARTERPDADTPPEPQLAARPVEADATDAPPQTEPPTQPGRPSTDTKGKDRTPGAPPVPPTSQVPQPGAPDPAAPPQTGRPPMDTKGRDRTPDAPRVPPTSQVPQPGAPDPAAPPQTGRPPMDTKGRDTRGRDRTSDAPEAPSTPQVPQPRAQSPAAPAQPSRPSTDTKGRDRTPDAPEAPQARAQEPSAQPQSARPAREGRGQQAAPRSAPQPAAPSRPKAGRPAAEDREKKDDEEPRGNERRRGEI